MRPTPIAALLLLAGCFMTSPAVAPGVKLRPKAFGRDRRLPITNRYRG
jgi:hypothetical protein